MPMPRKFAVVPLLLMAAACAATYFKVTDSATGKEYYTHDYTHKGAAVEFKDAKTGAKTSLPDADVLEIDAKTFDEGVRAGAR